LSPWARSSDSKKRSVSKKGAFLTQRNEFKREREKTTNIVRRLVLNQVGRHGTEELRKDVSVRLRRVVPQPNGVVVDGIGDQGGFRTARLVRVRRRSGPHEIGDGILVVLAVLRRDEPEVFCKTNARETDKQEGKGKASVMIGAHPCTVYDGGSRR